MELFTHIATLGIVALIFTILMKLIFVWIYKICLSSNVDPTKAVFITKGISTYLLAIVTSTFINQFAAKEASTGTLIVWGIVGVLYLCSWLTMQIHASREDLVRYPSSIAQGFMKYDGWLYLIAIVPYTLGFNDKIWIHNDPWGELLVRLSLWLISIPLLGLLLALFGVLVLIFMIGESAKEIVYQMRVRF